MSSGHDGAGSRLNSIADDEVPGGNYIPPGDGFEVREVDLSPIRDDARDLRLGMLPVMEQAGNSYSAAADLKAEDLHSGTALHATTRRFHRQTMNLQSDLQRIEEHLGITMSTHAGLDEASRGALAHIASTRSSLLDVFDVPPPGSGEGRGGDAGAPRPAEEHPHFRNLL
ncbi:hypothetical protein PJ985_04150 [Streptomyces sp. ACA25]|uniref:hypothetical protein n=1 Tax=Streptomyces sp. ACA25 TaxID=3022596 RepID=UPI0023079167|nr:hypothetical protein [Streptomyces sp. ACA25]MDB1086757.1 hypothetical protein [Streptomyces sp. ACA25]